MLEKLSFAIATCSFENISVSGKNRINAATGSVDWFARNLPQSKDNFVGEILQWRLLIFFFWNSARPTAERNKSGDGGQQVGRGDRWKWNAELPVNVDVDDILSGSRRDGGSVGGRYLPRERREHGVGGRACGVDNNRYRKRSVGRGKTRDKRIDKDGKLKLRRDRERM